MKASRSLNDRLVPALLLAVVVWAGAVSYLAPRLSGSESSLAKGEYRIATEVDGRECLYQGPVYFEFADRHSGSQNNPVFKLHFTTGQERPGRGFGFVIPLADSCRRIAREQYEVDSRKKRNSHKMDSVFGYADLFDGNGKMFFSETGSISINHVTEGEVVGEIDMLLKDESGNSMRLRGGFSALSL